MKDIRITDMKLVDGGFSQKIIDRHTSLRLSTTNFAPVTSAKGIVPRRRWLELTYAMPHTILRPDILNSFTTIKNMWNIFHLSDMGIQPIAGIKKELIELSLLNPQKIDTTHRPSGHTGREVFQPPTMKISQPMSYGRAVTRTETVDGQKTTVVKHVQPPSYERSDVRTVIRRGREPLQDEGRITVVKPAQPPSYERSDVRTVIRRGREPLQDEGRITVVKPAQPPRYERSDVRIVIRRGREPLQDEGRITVVKPAQPPRYERSDVRIVIQRGREPLHDEETMTVVKPVQPMIRETSAGGAWIERLRCEHTYIDHPLLTIAHRMLPSVGSVINTEIDRLMTEKTNIYGAYPEIEHVASTPAEIIKERVLEREVDSGSPEVTSQSAAVDIDRLADQVYSSIERKLVIEKERRGLYG